MNNTILNIRILTATEPEPAALAALRPDNQRNNQLLTTAQKGNRTTPILQPKKLECLKFYLLFA